MGMHNAPSGMTGVHTYYVTETTQEYLGNGNILVKNYSRRDGVLVHEFNCIIASPNLARASMALTAFVRSLISVGAWREDGEKVH